MPENPQHSLIHQCWKLKDVKLLHPAFQKNNHTFWGDIWTSADFTDKETVTFTTSCFMQADEGSISQPYEVIGNELVLMVGERKRGNNSLPVKISITRLTVNELGLKIILPDVPGNKFSGDFMEYLFEAAAG